MSKTSLGSPQTLCQHFPFRNSSKSSRCTSASERLGLTSLCDPQQDGDHNRGRPERPEHLEGWKLPLLTIKVKNSLDNKKI